METNGTLYHYSPNGSAIPQVLKWPALLLSYLFHPVFVPLYCIAFLVYVHPSYFTGFSEKEKFYTLLISAVNLLFFPLLTVGLLKALGFISSVFMRTKKDRIIPYIACSIFFFWAYLVFRNQANYPLILPSFIFGIFLSVNAGLIANIYFKISMHTLGMGGWLGLFLVIAFSQTMFITGFLCIVILLCGLVGTSRMALGSHSQKEIYSGFIWGMMGQFIAALFLLA